MLSYIIEQHIASRLGSSTSPLIQHPYFCGLQVIHFGHYQVDSAVIQSDEDQVHFLTGACL
jgi:hypothetical protein